jgi:hypothetical protein
MIGTAGSGKSLLTASFSNWMKMKEQDVVTVNLDPGAITLPYSPDVDIRNYFSIDGLMEKYGLGPNGALLMAADLIAGEVHKIRDELETLTPEYVLVDTPGQIELFAFRASGPYLAKELTSDPKAVVYLFDSSFSSNPLNYVSNMFLSAAVFNRLLLPQIHLLSKADLIPESLVDRIVDWGSSPEMLETAIEEQIPGSTQLLTRDIAQALSSIGLSFSLIPVSAKDASGFIDFHALLIRILSGE